MRIFGLGLVVALIAGAIGAASASAAKDPFTVNTWAQYKGCPYENEELTDCFYGRTNGGSTGGEFKYGNVSVKLNKPVVIQGGFKGADEEIQVSPATHGFETLESGQETIVNGLNVITTKLQEEANWPQALKESFKAAKNNKETKATLKIEMAGNECFETVGCLSTINLLERSGPVFKLALKVVISNPWLEKLGGTCQIGSDEHPIKQNLTAEGAGEVGELKFSEAFTNLEVKGSLLVDTGWHIEEAAGANGCGGPEYESYVDEALNKALRTFETSRTGITWLSGDLHDASREGVVTEGKESGEIP